MPLDSQGVAIEGTQLTDQLAGSGAGDVIVGLSGDDTINSHQGNDVVYGDFTDENLLTTPEGATSFAQYGESGAWTVANDSDGHTSMTQTLQTQAGANYSVSFDLASNYASGSVSGAVEVLWNGEVISAFDTNSAVFSSETVNFSGIDGIGELTFRSIEPTEAPSGPVINTDGPIFKYATNVETASGTVEVQAFAEGQSNLYQVLNGTLHMFDPQTETYSQAGSDATVKVNAIGFNIEDNLIYGTAVGNGVDSLGNAVSSADLIMLDANGDSFLIGETPYRSWTGDFDASGNLWAFQSSMDRLTMIDVDNVDANGVVASQTFKFPKEMITDQLWDVAFNAETQSFSGVTRPPSEGEAGILYNIDVSAVADGGEPVFTTTPVVATMIDGTLQDGMPAITFGGAIYDAEGNLYVAGNSGDHDMDNATSSSGAIYRVQTNAETGATYLELVADAPRAGSNDGAADPRASNPFGEVDQNASVLIRNPEAIITESSAETYNDLVEAGAGADIIYTGLGDDSAAGQSGNDLLEGGAGNDVLNGGNGQNNTLVINDYYDDEGTRYDEFGNVLAADDDQLLGQAGHDMLKGGAGHDILDGGIENDTLDGGSGFDTLIGGEGEDLLEGGSERDVLEGGDGDDELIGGSGTDMLSGDAGADILRGGSGDDTLDGGAGADVLNGGVGDDVLIGGTGNDFLEGSSGNDTLSSDFGDNEMQGGSGHDVLRGGSGIDNLIGGSGNDYLIGAGGRDILKGGTGNDVIDGGADKDKLYGGSGDDFIFGGAGSDYINASHGNDEIDAGAGRDKILLGKGSDVAFGGEDTDWFVFRSSDRDGSTDRILDFTRDGIENDRLDFRDMSLLGTDETKEDWIALHLTQNANNSVSIDLGNLKVLLYDHDSLGSDFFVQISDGLEL